MRRQERPLLALPRFLIVGFMLALGVQVATHQVMDDKRRYDYRPLEAPMETKIYQGIAMGSGQLLSYLLSMSLQMHDTQGGRHVRYEKINYHVLVSWLDLIGNLNLASEYPMFLATRVYSQSLDKQRLRVILDFIDRSFATNPSLFWRNQAEAVVIAKHKLGDLEFALKMAENLAGQPDSVQMPRWARDMHILLLADLNEYEATIAIIQAILQSGTVEDPDEEVFLREKLLRFQQKLFDSRQSSSN